jgi:hypothetical protein
MTTLHSDRVQALLPRLHAEAREGDSASFAKFEKLSATPQYFCSSSSIR